jgi:hypothetical protein
MPVANATLTRASQYPKQLDPILADEGMRIDSRDEQSLNAASPRLSILLPTSNVTVRRAWQLAKALSEMTSTDDGTQIDFNDVQESNAYSSIFETCAPASKVTIDSFWELRKHDLEINSIRDGIQTCIGEHRPSKADRSQSREPR